MNSATRAVAILIGAGALMLVACTDPEPEPNATTITHPVATTSSSTATSTLKPTPRRPDRSSITNPPGTVQPETEPPYTPLPTTLSAPEQAYLLRLEGIRPELTNDDNDALERGIGLCPVVAAGRSDEVLRSAVQLTYGRAGLDAEDADAVGVAVRELCKSLGPDAP